MNVSEQPTYFLSAVWTDRRVPESKLAAHHDVGVRKGVFPAGEEPARDPDQSADSGMVVAEYHADLAGICRYCGHHGRPPLDVLTDNRQEQVIIVTKALLS